MYIMFYATKTISQLVRITNEYLILINCLTKFHAHLPPSIIRTMINVDQNCFYLQPFEIVVW